MPRDNRFKRSIKNDDDDNGQTKPRQRKIRKFIRKLPNNNNDNNKNNNNNTLSDSDNKRNSNDNTQFKEIIHDEEKQLQSSLPLIIRTTEINPTRRRIVVPIRRTRVQLTEPIQRLPSIITTAAKITPNRKTVIMRRRIVPKSQQQLFKSFTSIKEVIASPTLSPPSTSIIDIVTRTTANLRTYTYFVTRVHDGHSETISSISLREKISTITDTITRTKTFVAAIEPTPLLTNYKTTTQRL